MDKKGKKGKDAKGKKKGKMPREEKERHRKELEERKILEDEVYKKQKEEEDKVNAERERMANERLIKRKLKEKKVRTEQETELRLVLDKYNQYAIQKQNYEWECNQWQYYLNKGGIPNPLVSSEINTYLSYWKEDAENDNLEQVLEESKVTLGLMDNVELALKKCPDLTESMKIGWEEALHNLRYLMKIKLDKASYRVFLESDRHIDPDTFNMQYETIDIEVVQPGKKADGSMSQISMEATNMDSVLTMSSLTLIAHKLKNLKLSGNITLCLWANLARNPRYKGPEFKMTQHAVELPRSLLITECALRILHLKYDPYTCQINLRKDDSTTESRKTFDDMRPTSRASLAMSQSKPSSATSDMKPEKQSTKKGSIKDRQKSTVKKSSIGKELEPETEEEQEEELGEMEEEDVETNINLKSGSGFDFFEDEYSEEAKDEEEEEKEEQVLEVLDIKENMILGGVYHLDLIQLPPQPRTIGPWTLFIIEEAKELQEIKFKTAVRQIKPAPSGMTPAESAEYAESENKRYEEELSQTISITLKVPDTVIFLDQPIPAFWEPAHKCWNMDGFYDLKYEEDNKLIYFKTNRFGVISLTQNRYSNFPYQSWELTPLEDQNAGVFTIMGTLVTLTLEIKEDKCKITKLRTLEEPIFPQLYDIWMDPDDLLHDLLNIGINFLPDDYTTTVIGNVAKDEAVQNATYKSMALYGNVFQLSSSHWNATCGHDTLVFKCLEFDMEESQEIQNTPLVLTTCEVSYYLDCTETSQTFSTESIPKTKFCGTLYHLLLSGINQQSRKKLSECSPDFYHTVFTILKLVQPLNYG